MGAASKLGSVYIFCKMYNCQSLQSMALQIVRETQHSEKLTCDSRRDPEGILQLAEWG